jgi:hypothetical protein
MTLIVNPTYFASKAELQAHLNTDSTILTEPSIMGEWTKYPSELPTGFSDVVTNHPIRSKFAQITKTEKGWIVK